MGTLTRTRSNKSSLQPLESTTKPRDIGFDCGFDFYPPLKRTAANQEQYELFLREVLDTYGPRDSAEHGDGGSVVRVNTDSEESYIGFEVGEYPHLPRRCEHFLRFSSKVSGSSLSRTSKERSRYMKCSGRQFARM